MEYIFILFGAMPFETKEQLGIFSTFWMATQIMMKNLKEFEENGFTRLEIKKQKINELVNNDEYSVSNYYEIELLKELL